MVSTSRRLSSPASLAVLCAALACLAGSVPLAGQAAQRTFPNAPDGFDVRQQGVQAGKVERIEYDSKVTNNKRPAVVYLPPG